VAGYITPGAGRRRPMTITMLLVNTIEAAEREAAARRKAEGSCGEVISRHANLQTSSSN